MGGRGAPVTCMPRFRVGDFLIKKVPQIRDSCETYFMDAGNKAAVVTKQKVDEIYSPRRFLPPRRAMFWPLRRTPGEKSGTRGTGRASVVAPAFGNAKKLKK